MGKTEKSPENVSVEQEKSVGEIEQVKSSSKKRKHKSKSKRDSKSPKDDQNESKKKKKSKKKSSRSKSASKDATDTKPASDERVSNPKSSRSSRASRSASRHRRRSPSRSHRHRRDYSNTRRNSYHSDRRAVTRHRSTSRHRAVKRSPTRSRSPSRPIIQQPTTYDRQYRPLAGANRFHNPSSYRYRNPENPRYLNNQYHHRVLYNPYNIADGQYHNRFGVMYRPSNPNMYFNRAYPFEQQFQSQLVDVMNPTVNKIDDKQPESLPKQEDFESDWSNDENDEKLEYSSLEIKRPTESMDSMFDEIFLRGNRVGDTLLEICGVERSHEFQSGYLSHWNLLEQVNEDKQSEFMFNFLYNNTITKNHSFKRIFELRKEEPQGRPVEANLFVKAVSLLKSSIMT